MFPTRHLLYDIDCHKRKICCIKNINVLKNKLLGQQTGFSSDYDCRPFFKTKIEQMGQRSKLFSGKMKGLFRIG
jgi:hypothetical protein